MKWSYNGCGIGPLTPALNEWKQSLEENVAIGLGTPHTVWLVSLLRGGPAMAKNLCGDWRWWIEIIPSRWTYFVLFEAFYYQKALG